MDTKSLMDTLENNYRFNLKGQGPISFHLGCDFFRGSNGVLCFAPYKYIENMVQTYMTMFDTNPKLQNSVRDPL